MLSSLQKNVQQEKNDSSIFDIVLYGSAVRGKINPRDIDIAVIFREGTLKQRLEKIQAIKKKIKENEFIIDIKGILWEELFQQEFFARSGIFVEGISLFDGKPFSYKMGFESSILFFYILKNKSHTEKIKFNYILRGRNDIGIIKKLQGTHLAPGVIKFPIKSAAEFEEILLQHTISYTKMNVLIQI